MSKEFIQLNIKERQLSAKIRFLSFKQDEHFIIYLPSLQISGYGDTENEAHELVKITFKDFAENLFKLKEEHRIISVLKDLGWVRNKFFKKRMSNLSQTTFEDIKKQFNIPDKTEVNEGLMTV